MAELNEEQLLLLNNLMYFDGAAQSGSSVEDIARRVKEIAANYNDNSFALSGGFESGPEQMIEIADAILNDPQLCDLYVTDAINTDGVRASCFVDSEGSATIAVRGSGGSYEAWSDNLEGAFDCDTKCQKQLQEFVKEQAEYYDNITVTGHSKGGNLAQYATVTEGNSIDRCVSFDGQGFNDEFCDKYADEIEKNKGKIKSISAEGDYVNILLNPIAGENVYMEGADGLDAHSSYYLWKKNNGKIVNDCYDADGTQYEYIKVIDAVLEKLVDAVSFLPDAIEKKIVYFLGSLAGLFFAFKSGQLSYNDLVRMIGNALETMNLSWIGNWLLEQIKKLIKKIDEESDKHNSSGKKDGSKKSSNVIKSMSFSVICNNAKSVEDKLDKYEKQTKQYANKVGEIRLSGGTYYEINRTIQHIKKKMEKNASEFDMLHKNLHEIIQLYEKTEQVCFRKAILRR